jgi:hypothetical protein
MTATPKKKRQSRKAVKASRPSPVHVLALTPKTKKAKKLAEEGTI